MRAAFVVFAFLFAATLSLAARAEAVVVASKKFPESVLLSELLSQLLESRGIDVERRLNMGNTAVVFENLRRGNVDVYPEYSGTAMEFLGLSRQGELPLRARVERSLSQQGLHLGPPLGFENSYGLAVRGELARRHSLHTISDLATLVKTDERVRFGLTHEFMARQDGFDGLKRAYGFDAPARGVEHGLAYELLSQRQLDVTEVYTTEGLLHAGDLTVLKDDLAFFPPYDAAFLYGSGFARSPLALDALLVLAGRLDPETVRRLNYAIEVEKRDISEVATQWLVEQGLVAGGGESTATRRAGFSDLLFTSKTWQRLVRHLWLTLVSVSLGVAFGVPLGVLATRRRLMATVILGGAGIVQTIPSLALLVLVIPLATALAVVLPGDAMVLAALTALFGYSLLPIVRNTMEGLRSIDAAVIDAATGMGMSRYQRFAWVLFPLSLPFILAGIRTAAVIATGSATLAAFIGAGGLGEAIISGLSVQNYAEVLTGAVPAAALALGIDGLFSILQRFTAPKT